MKLVKNAKKAWKWWSVQALAISGALPVVWVTLPPDLKAGVPDTLIPYIAAGVAIAGIFGRVVDQGSADE